MTGFTEDEMERFRAKVGESSNLPDDSEIEVTFPNGEKMWHELKSVRVISMGGPVPATSHGALTREVAIRAMSRLKTRQPEKPR